LVACLIPSLARPRKNISRGEYKNKKYLTCQQPHRLFNPFQSNPTDIHSKREPFRDFIRWKGGGRSPGDSLGGLVAALSPGPLSPSATWTPHFAFQYNNNKKTTKKRVWKRKEYST